MFSNENSMNDPLIHFDGLLKFNFNASRILLERASEVWPNKIKILKEKLSCFH